MKKDECFNLKANSAENLKAPDKKGSQKANGDLVLKTRAWVSSLVSSHLPYGLREAATAVKGYKSAFEHSCGKQFRVPRKIKNNLQGGQHNWTN